MLKDVCASSASSSATATATTECEEVISAVGYIRTSSSANVGDDKDSQSRQLKAILQYAEDNGLNVPPHHIFSDPAVAGTDPVGSRPSFVKLIGFCEDNGIKIIIFEDNTRLARDLMVQELAYAELVEKAGYTLISTKHPSQFREDGVTAKLVRQILGAIAEFDKGQVVDRLRHGRAKRAATTLEKTMSGSPRVCGKRSRLDGPDGDNIKSLLAPFVTATGVLASGVLTQAVDALANANMVTATGEKILHAQVQTWLQSLTRSAQTLRQSVS